MSTFLTVLLVLAMLGVLGVLGVGVATMIRGGNPRLSNRLMQGRVVMQAVALALLVLQNELFDLGADLCTPETGRRPSTHRGGALRIAAAQVERLEREIDTMNAALRPLDSFILPGGSPAAAHLHLARTVTRRAERLVCALAVAEPVNPEAIKYLNRLSDHLFMLGRRVNDGGARDVLWRPGATR